MEEGNKEGLTLVASTKKGKHEPALNKGEMSCVQALLHCI
jgi:hypothetical protein